MKRWYFNGIYAQKFWKISSNAYNGVSIHLALVLFTHTRKTLEDICPAVGPASESRGCGVKQQVDVCLKLECISARPWIASIACVL